MLVVQAPQCWLVSVLAVLLVLQLLPVPPLVALVAVDHVLKQMLIM